MPYPWMLQYQLQGGRDYSSSEDDTDDRSNKRQRRTVIPDALTPATFALNWNHSENGATNPTPEKHVSTFMGVTNSTEVDGKLGSSYDSRESYALKVIVDKMRNEGYRLPDFEQSEDVEDKYKGLSKEEIYILERQHVLYEVLEILEKESDEVAFIFEFLCGWIYIRCNNEEAAKFVESNLNNSLFYLGQVQHVSDSIQKDDGVVIRWRTGTNPSGKDESNTSETSTSVGTLFELLKFDKVVAKVLCSYKNCEMDNSGPTIELIETAKLWRNQGYATLLLDEVTGYFQDVFENVDRSGEDVNFNICHCTNYEAFKWFCSQDFNDWDGMGEELGKSLF